MRQRWFVLALLVVVAVPMTAQRGGRRFGGFGRFAPAPAATPYDGQFAIVRLWYPRYSGWSYDYPEMEQNLNLILSEVTAITPSPSGGNVLRMDDPELMKFPIAYLSEPGYWFPSDAEVEGLRTYIEKGGFLIVDDFHFGEEWAVFESAMTRVLPQGRIIRLDASHPIFNTFFSIESLDVPYPGRLGQQGLMGEFYGIHEQNDPTRRLSVVINYNMDIGDYMEHSATGRYAVDPSNEAYKFGINYLIYGMTR
ncbi:MAG: DUF4159 domain-containing protein [Acidobacteria bacterium]|jgi:hypothetical protein|nr:DUF4159 domain-containing protein [Acidobacteriota bacterium]